MKCWDRSSNLIGRRLDNRLRTQHIPNRSLDLYPCKAKICFPLHLFHLKKWHSDTSNFSSHKLEMSSLSSISLMSNIQSSSFFFPNVILNLILYYPFCIEVISKSTLRLFLFLRAFWLFQFHLLPLVHSLHSKDLAKHKYNLIPLLLKTLHQLPTDLE